MHVSKRETISLDTTRHRNPKKIGFWMWFWIFKSKTKIKQKHPKNQKTTSKTKP